MGVYLSTVQIGQPLRSPSPGQEGMTRGLPHPRGQTQKVCVMQVSNLVAFERFFDRSVSVFLVGLGLVLVGGMAFVGA